MTAKVDIDSGERCTIDIKVVNRECAKSKRAVAGRRTILKLAAAAESPEEGAELTQRLSRPEPCHWSAAGTRVAGCRWRSCQ